MNQIQKIEKLLNRWEPILWILSLLMIVVANYLIFMVVPNERTMGAVQRILYFHVGSAIACYLAFALVFISSVLYLVKKNHFFDALNVSAGEVGFLFCSIVLATGMIWGKASWGTWFQMEPRLITFLFLWMIFLAFNILRAFDDKLTKANHSAVLGIVGAITVPIMVYSIKLLPASKQLHPEVIEKAGLPPVMLYTMCFSILTVIVLQFLLISMRFRIELRSKN